MLDYLCFSYYEIKLVIRKSHLLDAIYFINIHINYFDRVLLEIDGIGKHSKDKIEAKFLDRSVDIKIFDFKD